MQFDDDRPFTSAAQAAHEPFSKFVYELHDQGHNIGLIALVCRLMLTELVYNYGGQDTYQYHREVEDDYLDNRNIQDVTKVH